MLVTGLVNTAAVEVDYDPVGESIKSTTGHIFEIIGIDSPPATQMRKNSHKSL